MVDTSRIETSQPEKPQKERIRRIAAKLFAEKGYQAVGVAELGEAVGLGRGALYYHIDSKEYLLYDIVIRYITDLVTAGNSILYEYTDPHERIIRLSRYLMRTIAGHLSELTVCFREADALTGERHAEVSRLRYEYEDIWARTMREGAELGTFRMLPPVALKGILGMYCYSFLWFNPDSGQSPDEIAEVFADIVFRAAEVEKERPKRVRR